MARVLLVGKGKPERGGIPTYIDMLLGSELDEMHTLRFLNVAEGDSRRGGKLTLRNVSRTVGDVVRVFSEAQGADVVHIHTALAPTVTAVRAGLLATAARARDCGVLVHVHGGLVPRWMDRPSRRRLLRLAMRSARVVVAVSQDVEAALLPELGRDRVRFIVNGVDVQRFSPALSRRVGVPRVLYVGLLTPRKGVLDLFEASRLLTGEGVEHELVLVGGTPTEGKHAEEQVRAAAPPTASLVGERHSAQMPEEYRAADVFCLPSWWEAMPLSVLEAMASALPVVATDVGDISRMVDDGTTGRLVPTRSPDKLAAALRELLEDAALRQRMGAEGRRLAVSQFSLERTTRALSRLYAELEARAR